MLKTFNSLQSSFLITRYRTSNAELIFEEDINTALQLSSTEKWQNYESDDDIVEQKRKKAKKTVIEG